MWNVFGDLEYLGSGYDKGGDVDVFDGMGCVRGELKKVRSEGFDMFRERIEL